MNNLKNLINFIVDNAMIFYAFNIFDFALQINRILTENAHEPIVNGIVPMKGF